MVAERKPSGLTDDLARLASALEEADLRGADLLDLDLSHTRDRLVSTVRSYLIPRIEDPRAPLLVVIAGSTGSGKSTLMNSLAGMDLADTGPLRPTTTMPLILTRDTGQLVDIGGVDCEVVTGGAPILNHMTLVDTPDMDSTTAGHRAMAEALVDRADVVVFVASGIRYADNAPWEILRRAQSRGAALIPVLNRVGAEAGAAVQDFRRRLASAGITEDLVWMPEHHLGSASLQVPSLAVRELKRRLYRVAHEQRRYQAEVVNRVVNSTAQQVTELASQIDHLRIEIDEMESRLVDQMSGAAEVDERDRKWAQFPLPTCPQGRFRAGRWRRRSDPSVSELQVWRQAVMAGLVAEHESKVRAVLATQEHGVVAPEASIPVLRDVRALLESAVTGWFEDVDRRAAVTRNPRLSAAVATAASITSVEQEIIDSVFGGEHYDLVEIARDLLEARVTVVFDHVGERLGEMWRLRVGEPSADHLTGRLAAVHAAYQFADA